jgi:hypothetical protein
VRQLCSGKQDFDGIGQPENVLASTRLCFVTIAKINSRSRHFLRELREWLLISYNLTRSLEGDEAFGVMRAEEETDDPESKGCCFYWIAGYRGNRSGRDDLYQHLSIRDLLSGGLPAFSRFGLSQRREWNHDYVESRYSQVRRTHDAFRGQQYRY